MANVHRTGGKNQKIIKVIKEKCDRENLYAIHNLKATYKAAQELRPNAFKLWLYFVINQNNYEFALSSKAVERDFNIKIDAYNGAIKELLEKGYLVKRTDTDEEYYYFYEMPRYGKNPQGIKDVMGKDHKGVMVKTHKGLQEKTITGYGKRPQQILQDSTINNTQAQAATAAACNITGKNSTSAAATTSPHREEVEEDYFTF